MRRWLPFLLLLLAATAFARVPAPAALSPPTPTHHRLAKVEGRDPARYGYDDHATTRFPTAKHEATTDTYTYDAIGNSIAPTPTSGSQRSNDGFCGERDNTDFCEGNSTDPLSLHKYLYAHANPVNGIDPSGHENLISLSIGSGISQSLASIYNGVVSASGSAMQATLFGVQAGRGMNEILTDFVLDETGIGLAVDAFQALRGYFRDDEIADLAIFYQHFDVASLPLLVEDSDYTPTDLDRQEPQCFVAGTLVLTEQGMKAIESIKAGDQVWAYDVTSSNRVLKPVVKTFIRQRQDWMKLQINDETVEVTGEHPFFIPGTGWVAAASLKAGDRLLAFDSENKVHVRATEWLPGGVTVYNFEVQDLHDYFITDEGVLVHNLGAGIHHFLTKALGSKLPYGHRIIRAAGKLNAVAHTALHQALNQHLRNWRGGNMCPSRINPGRDIRRNFPRNERLRALSEFYRNYDGGRYWEPFKAELKAMVQKGGGGLDPSLFQ